MKKIILTGDRPSGKLHLGHYVGSLKNRIALQNTNEYEMFILIADLQALTDNAYNPVKVTKSVIDITLDYLSCGIDPSKVSIVIQSQIPALYELPMLFSNLVTVSRLKRNPTVKSEINQKDFATSLPVGFFTYPISQAADILAFGAHLVPVGLDQLPMLEQTREIAQSFNKTYNVDLFTMPKALSPENDAEGRLVGIDGKNKMSKSLNNCIYLSDSKEEVKKKVMSMYTDENHIKIEDPGKVEGNVVFQYLDIFAKDESFSTHLPNYNNLDELKEHYTKGGLGDVVLKKFLINILEDIIAPMREKRAYYEENIELVHNILKNGTDYAVNYTNKILNDAKKAVGINYFENWN